MHRRLAPVFSAPLFALVLFESSEARALGPVKVEVGGRIGYATNPSGGDTTPLGIGVGGRAGVEFLGGVYAGLSGIYYFGSGEGVSVNANVPYLVAGQQFRQHGLLLGAEGGYSVHLSFLTIRPELGIGEATFTDTAEGVKNISDRVSISDSTTSIYFEPGAMVLVNVGVVYFGIDASVLLVPGVANEVSGPGGVAKAASKTYASFTSHAQVGVRF